MRRESIGHAPEQDGLLRKKARQAKTGPAPPTPTRSNDLSSSLGNRGTGRLVQAKLRVSQPSDPAELEADNVARQVLDANATPAPAAPATSTGGGPAIHRACAQCDAATSPGHLLDEEEEGQREGAQVMRRGEGAAGGGAAAAGLGAGAVNRAADVAQGGAGQSIEPGERQFFEQRFGRGFGDVRVHTGGQAADAARAINAQAYTVGRDIVFGESQYAPGTSEGRSLLAHELTHVVQQEGSTPTLHRRDMPLNPVSIAQQLDAAMRGPGTDEESIYAALSGRTKEQLEEITQAYKNLTSGTTGGDLMKDLRDELTEGEWLYLAGLIVGAETPERRAEAVAVQLHNAMSGPGTDEDAIYAALDGRSAAEVEEIKKAYDRVYKLDLIRELNDELSGDELWRALGAMGTPPTVYDQNTELGMLSVGNFDFHFKNCEVLVWVWIKYKFTDDISAADRTAFKARFQQAVDDKWANSGYGLSGGASCPCPSVPIKVHVEENPGSFYHKLVDVEDNPGRRASVISDINVNLDTSDRVLAHEFGHVLGLYDEYDGGFFENMMFWHKNVPDPDAEMSGGMKELRPRYFEHYRRRVQATAPHGCFYTITSPPPGP